MPEQVGEFVEQDGELFSPTWSFTWIETGATIAEGTLIAPVALPAGDDTVEHASLHLALDDLALARACLLEASKLGVPNNEDMIAKGLIHAAVIAYARPFANGVRGFHLTPSFFDGHWGEAEVHLHEYLYALRDKHVAHSVNDFERATTVGVVVTDKSFRLIDTNPSGVGVTKLSMVGLPMSKLRLCPDHIGSMISKIESRIVELRAIIHERTRSLLRVGEPIEIAPVMTLADRSKIAERRK